MKIEATDKNCILARLSGEDLDLLELTYDELDYANEKARKALRHILDMASEQTGSALNRAKKLKIDVLPDFLGGCLIMFSSPDSEKSEACFFLTESIDSLLDLAKAAKSLNITAPQSALYKAGESYRLEVRGVSESLKHLLNEFLLTQHCGGECLKGTAQAWECIIEKDALKILGGALS